MRRLGSLVRLGSIVTGAATLAFSCQLLVASTATANYVSGTGPVVHYGSGLCMDDPAFSTAQGTRMQLFPCNGKLNQQWHESVYTVCPLLACPDGLGEIEVAQIRNMFSNLCLNVSGASNRNFTPAIQWACDPNYTNEQFYVKGVFPGPPDWNLYAVRIGTCLDDPYNSKVTYTKLEFYQCNLSIAQTWVGSQWVGVGL
jgi:endo-1,4-beta-xylanase